MLIEQLKYQHTQYRVKKIMTETRSIKTLLRSQCHYIELTEITNKLSTHYELSWVLDKLWLKKEVQLRSYVTCDNWNRNQIKNYHIFCQLVWDFWKHLSSCTNTSTILVQARLGLFETLPISLSYFYFFDSVDVPGPVPSVGVLAVRDVVVGHPGLRAPLVPALGHDTRHLGKIILYWCCFVLLVVKCWWRIICFRL